MELQGLGKVLIIFGVALILLGVALVLGVRISWFGRLPGDIYIQKKNFMFYFPVATSILVSIIITTVFLFLRRR